MNTPLDNAKWIWRNDYHNPNTYLDFYDNVNAVAGKKYLMYISVDSNYALYIDGKFVESGQFADYPDYKVYDVIDITENLRAGKNEIKVVAFWQGRDFSTYRKEAAGLIYAVTEDDAVVAQSDENTAVCLNSAFRSEGVPAVTGQLGFAFDYDATKEDEKIGFKTADVQDKKVNLNPRPVNKLDIGSQMPAHIIARGDVRDGGAFSNVAERMQNAYMAFSYNGNKKPLPCESGYEFKTERADGDGIYFIVDLGEETVGYTDLEIEVPEECDILIGHGEHLEDLRVRASVGGRVFVNRYHAKAGLNKFFNPLRRMGLRYLQINVYAPSAKIYYAGIRTAHYRVSHKPYFKCSDNLHNKIYEISLKTLEHCMHEHYEDCPWREQSLYSMDSRNQMLCGYFAFGEFDFAKASLRLIALSLRDDGFTELCSPARVPITIPSFTAIYVTQVYEYVLYSGDVAFAAEVFDVLVKICRNFTERQAENGLVVTPQDPKYWNFYEWQTGMDNGDGGNNHSENTYAAPLNAFVSMAFESLSRICKMLNKNDLAADYLQKHNALNAVVDREFWCEEKKAYYTYIHINSGEKTHFSQLNQALVVYCGACSENKLDAVLNNIVNGGFYEATLSHTIFVYDALMKRPEKYAKYVLKDIADKWGYMLYSGATTFWETIDGAAAFANAGSLCHGWSAVPVYIYFRYACGFKVTGEGDVSYKIEPVDCGLYECDAMICTPKGEIKAND